MASEEKPPDNPKAEKALHKLWRTTRNQLEERGKVTKLLGKITGNILKSPNEPKFRRMKREILLKKFTNCDGGMDFLTAAGFCSDINGKFMEFYGNRFVEIKGAIEALERKQNEPEPEWDAILAAKKKEKEEAAEAARVAAEADAAANNQEDELARAIAASLEDQGDAKAAEKDPDAAMDVDGGDGEAKPADGAEAKPEEATEPEMPDTWGDDLQRGEAAVKFKDMPQAAEVIANMNGAQVGASVVTACFYPEGSEESSSVKIANLVGEVKYNDLDKLISQLCPNSKIDRLRYFKKAGKGDPLGTNPWYDSKAPKSEVAMDVDMDDPFMAAMMEKKKNKLNLKDLAGLSAEEKKRRILEARDQYKQRNVMAAVRENAAKETRSRENVKKQMEAERIREETRLKQFAEKKKREKKREKEKKRRIREKIKADKERRKREAAAKKAGKVSNDDPYNPY